MTKHTIASALFVAATLTGCGNPEVEAIKDVAYYSANPSEMQEKVTECRNNPGLLKENANCMNAMEADRRSMTGPSTVDFSKAFKN